MSDCPHFGLCGGCTTINLSYEESLKQKEKEIAGLITPIIRAGQKEDALFEGILPSPVPYEYRNKMEFSFGDDKKGGPLTLGLHRRKSFYDVINVPECRIVDGDFRQILRVTRDFFEKLPYYHKKSREGYLRHLLVRKASATGQILTDLVTTGQVGFLPENEGELLGKWVEVLLGLELKGSFAGILHTRNDSPADSVINEATECLYGRDFFEEELLGLHFKITPFSFFQTNSHGAKVLYTKVREYAELLGKDSQKVFDLYCGTGTISQLLVRDGRQVVGVEMVEEAVEAAKSNAAMNGFTPRQVDFICGDVLKVLDDLKETPELIVLDPPRDGVHPKALPKILDYRAKSLIYVSCKPKSLARDLEPILERGYHVLKYAVIDQFPHTANMETVCALSLI